MEPLTLSIIPSQELQGNVETSNTGDTNDVESGIVSLEIHDTTSVAPTSHYDANKVRGMILGACLGDALGAPYEFRTGHNLKYTGTFSYDTTMPTRYQGVRTIPKGQGTDDTEMTLVLLRSIITNRGYNREAVLIDYMKWSNSGWAQGRNTKALFKGVTTIEGYTNRLESVVHSKPQDEWSQSNGALMRCSPLALLSMNSPGGADDPINIDCSLTNPHPVCIDTNRVYVSALRMALQGYSKDIILSYLPKIAQTEEVKGILNSLDTWRDLSDKKGWCLHGLWAALVALKCSVSYEEGIDWTISANHKSDTDTNACIAGALLGAYYGYTSMIQQERTRYNLAYLLQHDSTQGPYPRPVEYTLRDIEALLHAI